MKPTKSPPRRPGSTSIGTMARAILLLLTLALFAHAAAPPAGSPIGNQATATYKDAGDNERTATSNKVTTIVQQVAGLALVNDQSKLVAPGGQVYFTHTLTNTGNGSDTYDLKWAHTSGDSLLDTAGVVNIYADLNGDGIPDNSTPITNTGALAAGGVFKFVVVSTVSGTATGESVGTITATSQHSPTDPAATAFNTDKLTVTATAPVISITKAMSSTQGPSPSVAPHHVVTFTYKNTGNSAATDVLISDKLPTGMTYAGSPRWSLTGTTDLVLDTPTTASGKTIKVTKTGVAPALETFTALISKVEPGETRTISFVVSINSGLNAQILENTGEFTFKDSDGANPSTPANTNTVNFVVTTSAGVTIVTDGPVPSVPQGGTAVFKNTVTNTGNAPDTFDITFKPIGNTYPAGTSFYLYKSDGNALLVDTDGNGIPDTGILAVGASYDVVVKVVLPSGVSGDGPFSVTKVATSKNDPTKSKETQDVVTKITKNTVDLTNTAPAGSPGALGEGPGTSTIIVTKTDVIPGTTVTFDLFAKNTSDVSDNYNISAISLPPGWSVVFKDGSGAPITNTGLVLAGGNKKIVAYVTVPAGEIPGSKSVEFQILSPVSGAKDTIVDAVVVSTVRNLVLEPNHSGQIFPGGTVLYNHKLTNKGNVNEGAAASDITLALTNDVTGWASIIYLDANGNGEIDPGDTIISSSAEIPVLAPGTSIALIVKVSAPPGAAIGTVNVTDVKATTSVGLYTGITPPPTVSVRDTTTVIDSDLVITKKQAKGISGGTFTSDQLADAAPGSVIRYQLTVTNNGTVKATNVVIRDTIPSFTTYTDDGGAAAITPTGTIVKPSVGATGSLEFTVGELAPGASATATFSVKIDQ